MCRRAEELPLPALRPQEDDAAHPRDEHAGGPYYIPCLRCDELMVRRNFQGRSGIVIDLCRHHGVWLDHSELERIVAWIRENGPVRARAGYRVQPWDASDAPEPARAARPAPALPELDRERGGKGRVLEAIGWVLAGVLEAFTVEL